MPNKMKCRIVSIGAGDAFYPNRDVIVGALVEIDTTFEPNLENFSGKATYIGRKTLRWIHLGDEVVYPKGEWFFFASAVLEEVKK